MNHVTFRNNKKSTMSESYGFVGDLIVTNLSDISVVFTIYAFQKVARCFFFIFYIFRELSQQNFPMTLVVYHLQAETSWY